MLYAQTHGTIVIGLGLAVTGLGLVAALGSNLLQQPWLLDAVAPGHCDEVTLERGGRVVARLPYVMRGRSRLRVLTMPPLTQTLGPWVERSEAKTAHALSEEHEL